MSPTQEYACPNDGAFDIHLTFADDVPQFSPCPTCGCDSDHVLRAPAGIKIVSTWNDEANEMRRDPYTQAKYQAQHSYDEARDSGISVEKVTEAGLQVAAKAIDAANKAPRQPSDAQRAVKETRRLRKEKATSPE